LYIGAVLDLKGLLQLLYSFRSAQSKQGLYFFALSKKTTI